MSIVTLEYLSGAMMRMVRVQIILPHEEMHPDRADLPPWKTLFFLPGMTETASSVLHTVGLTAVASQYGIAIVLPDGENSFYKNDPKQNKYYEDYVAKELVSVSRKLFPLSDRWEDTWIGGISMGGFGALMLGMKQKETFSKIAVLSPACQLYDMADQGCLPLTMMDDLFGSRENYINDYDPYSLMKKAKDAGKAIPDLFVRCGTEDRLTYRVCHALNEKLREEKIPVDYRESPGEHQFLYWNTQLKDMMIFLTGKKD